MPIRVLLGGGMRDANTEPPQSRQGILRHEQAPGQGDRQPAGAAAKAGTRRLIGQNYVPAMLARLEGATQGPDPSLLS
jgi:hypothetical protein